MAIIKELALSKGGGIVSYNQQAEQEKNVINIFIGLGKTGVDCIREIKTHVYDWIKQDLISEAGAAVYKSIRFMGVERIERANQMLDKMEKLLNLIND